MKITVNDVWTLRSYFERYNRDYYSEAGYDWMLDYYEEDMEMDVIGICGDLTEYGDHASLSFKDFLSDHGSRLECGGFSHWDLSEMDDDDVDAYVDELIEALGEETVCERLSNGDVMVGFY